MSIPQPGDRVRIVRPDLPRHAEGTVVAPSHKDAAAWPLWVEHDCPCWQPITGQPTHILGYAIEEVVPC